jgi:uncharacterized protein (TIRG00374 family)
VQDVEGHRTQPRFGRRVYRRVLSALGIVIFGAVLYYGGVEALRQVARVNPLYLACTFVAAALAALVTSVRWGLIVDALEGRRAHSKLQYFYYVMMGKMSSTLVSQYVGDYGVRPLALKASSDTSMGRAFYSVVLDRFFDLALSLLFLIPGLLYLGGLISPQVLALLITLLVGGYWAVIAKNHHLVSHVLGLLAGGVSSMSTRIPRLRGVLAQVTRTLEGAQTGFEQVGRTCINSANLLTLCRYLAMAFRAYFLSLALGLSIPFWLVFLAVGLVRFALVFAVAPGRLGVLEIGWYGVLALGGVETSAILPFLIALRVYGLVFNAALALGAHLAVSLRPRTTA